ERLAAALDGLAPLLHRFAPELDDLAALLAPLVDDRRQVLALAMDELAALLAQLVGTLTAFARLLGELTPRLLARGRRVQQRHGGTSGRADQERQEHAARVALLCHVVPPARRC